MSKVSTVSGRRVDLLNPVEADIDIHDIAHGLSNICRYGGQTNCFYSVAQHSVALSVVAPTLEHYRDPNLTDWQLTQIAKAALLHDAAEAYTGDIKTPVKELLPDFAERIEGPITDVIFSRYRVSTEWLSHVNPYDKQIVINEMKQFFFTGVPLELLGREPIEGLTLSPQSPEEARRWFFDRFKSLFDGEERELRYA